MQFDQNGFPISDADAATAAANAAPEPRTESPSDELVQSALASLSAPVQAQKAPPIGEIKWRLTSMLYPAILLLFVALYVTCLGAGTEPEVALLQAGGVSVVLAVLGRLAVGILGDDTRLVLDDSQIVAMARNGAVRDYLSGSGAARDAAGAELPPTAAQAASAGGKE